MFGLTSLNIFKVIDRGDVGLLIEYMSQNQHWFEEKIDRGNRRGYNALMYAISSELIKPKQLDIITALLAQMPPNAINDVLEDGCVFPGESALMLSVRQGCRLDMVKALLEDDYIDINIQNKTGETALHLAVSQGNGGITAILLNQASCQPSIKNDQALSPLKLVIEKLLMVMRMLVASGKSPNAVNVMDSDKEYLFILKSFIQNEWVEVESLHTLLLLISMTLKDKWIFNRLLMDERVDFNKEDMSAMIVDFILTCSGVEVTKEQLQMLGNLLIHHKLDLSKVDLTLHAKNLKARAMLEGANHYPKLTCYEEKKEYVPLSEVVVIPNGVVVNYQQLNHQGNFSGVLSSRQEGGACINPGKPWSGKS